jgi:hypothetical protein
MKHIALALTALFAAATAFAQGTVNFATRITGSVDARVTYGGAPAGSTFMGQLYAAAPGGTLAPVGAPVPFRDTPDAAKGYITSGGTVEIPGVAAGATAQVKLVAWAASLGATFAEAQGKGQGGWGESATIPSVTTGGGTLPPGALVGLTGFEVSPIIPEPSIAALGLLGAGLLLIRRKK